MWTEVMCATSGLCPYKEVSCPPLAFLLLLTKKRTQWWQLDPPSLSQDGSQDMLRKTEQGRSHDPLHYVLT